MGAGELALIAVVALMVFVGGRVVRPPAARRAIAAGWWRRRSRGVEPGGANDSSRREVPFATPGWLSPYAWVPVAAVAISAAPVFVALAFASGRCQPSSAAAIAAAWFLPCAFGAGTAFALRARTLAHATVRLLVVVTGSALLALRVAAIGSDMRTTAVIAAPAAAIAALPLLQLVNAMFEVEHDPSHEGREWVLSRALAQVVVFSIFAALLCCPRAEDRALVPALIAAGGLIALGATVQLRVRRAAWLRRVAAGTDRAFELVADPDGSPPGLLPLFHAAGESTRVVVRTGPDAYRRPGTIAICRAPEVGPTARAMLSDALGAAASAACVMLVAMALLAVWLAR